MISNISKKIALITGAALDKQYVMENYEVLPENINFGVKSSVAINLLNANDVSFSFRKIYIFS